MRVAGGFCLVAVVLSVGAPRLAAATLLTWQWSGPITGSWVQSDYYEYYQVEPPSAPVGSTVTLRITFDPTSPKDNCLDDPNSGSYYNAVQFASLSFGQYFLSVPNGFILANSPDNTCGDDFTNLIEFVVFFPLPLPDSSELKVFATLGQPNVGQIPTTHPDRGNIIAAVAHDGNLFGFAGPAQITTIPEPATLALAAVGIPWMLSRRRHRADRTPSSNQ